MIDIENIVFTQVYDMVKVDYPQAEVVSEYVEMPEAFPHISLLEVDNSIYQKSITLDNMENHVSVVYECNIYTNRVGAKKTEAKEIANLIDEKMKTLGFKRTLFNQIPNINRTIYRIVMRWSAVVEQGIQDDNGDTVYRIYSK